MDRSVIDTIVVIAPGEQRGRGRGMKNTATIEPTYVWFWTEKARPALGDRKGQPCRVLARGKMNSIMVEFEDGKRVITSRYAVRRLEDREESG